MYLARRLAVLLVFPLDGPGHEDDVVLRHDELRRARLLALGGDQLGADRGVVAEAAGRVGLVPGEELRGAGSFQLYA